MAVTFIHPPSAIRHPRRILVRGVNWLGDAVMTTPALLRLREKFPTAHIALLCPEKLRDLWLHHPAVDETIPFAAGESVFSVAKKIRRWGETPSSPNFDLALVLPNSPRSALEVFLGGIPQRIGYARPWRNFFLTQAVASRVGAVKMRKRTGEEIKALVSRHPASNIQPPVIPAAAHQTHEYLHLAAALGANPEPLAPQLVVTPAELGEAQQHFLIDGQTQWVGINLGAEYGPAKRWPAENFLFMAREAAAWTGGWGVILFGGKSDVPTVEKIEQEFWSVASQWKFRPKLVNLAGRTSLRELMALLKLCRVLLTNDTGPMHVAAALGTPVVVPFGSTSPELTGPGLPGDARHQLIKSDAPCSPCFLRECPIDFRCMNGISTGAVVEAVIRAAANKL
ncbi:MAG: ADP-heptose--LPS heptosyltransferase 2 [Verrucomicrobiota bacterium]|jgi:heptosyltransferase-2